MAGQAGVDQQRGEFQGRPAPGLLVDFGAGALAGEDRGLGAGALLQAVPFGLSCAPLGVNFSRLVGAVLALAGDLAQAEFRRVGLKTLHLTRQRRLVEPIRDQSEIFGLRLDLPFRRLARGKTRRQ